MSITGRLIIDRIKRSVSRYISFPVPPYGTPNFWESSYQRLAPHDVNEWGLDFAKLKEYRYKKVALSAEHWIALGGSGGSAAKNHPSSASTDATAGGSGGNTDPSQTPASTADKVEEYSKTTFGETIGVYSQAATDEPILILGCGNSKLGEDMVDAKWRGPIVQLDVASRVVDTMSIRCASHLTTGNMQIVQDDATLLSAIADAKVKAVIDKGLLDALFCADEFHQVTDIMRATHRVLEPGGSLVTFSYSHPDYFLSRLLLHGAGAAGHAAPARRIKVPWKTVDIRQLDTIYLYRFTKAPPKAVPHRASKKFSSSGGGGGRGRHR